MVTLLTIISHSVIAHAHAGTCAHAMMGFIFSVSSVTNLVHSRSRIMRAGVWCDD